MKTAAAIDIRDATVRYGRMKAVNGVTLSVQRNEIFGMLGPNGSGKTTLIRSLCGLHGFASGTVSVLGQEIHGRTDSAFRRRLGYMSQRFALYEDLTARENLNFQAGIYGVTGRAAVSRTDELIALTGLSPYLSRQARKLSAGWRQRLALACALLHDPELLFLDEPTAEIDPATRRGLWDLLLGLPMRGITLFVTTHYMDEAERCDRLGYLYYGRLLAVGTPQELRELPAVNPPGVCRCRITSANLSATLARMRAHPSVLQATIYSQAIHAAIQSDVRAVQSDFPEASISTVEPTLEDVFVSLAEDAARTEERAVHA